MFGMKNIGKGIASALERKHGSNENSQAAPAAGDSSKACSPTTGDVVQEGLLTAFFHERPKVLLSLADELRQWQEENAGKVGDNSPVGDPILGPQYPLMMLYPTYFGVLKRYGRSGVNQDWQYRGMVRAVHSRYPAHHWHW